MSSIDNRVVKMMFDNREFERNASVSMTTLDKLKKSLNFDGATKGLEDIDSAARKVDLKGLSEGVDFLKERFSTMGIVGMTVLSDLTRSALNFASNMASKVIDPIVSGGKNRAFAIENARFSLQGLISDEKEVQAIMDDALESVDGTAYAYNDAASAAAQFAATGLRSGKEMQETLRGIAGVAATTNSEYSEISHIFTTVAGNGRLMTEQLNQFSYRGMNAAASLTSAFNDVLHGSSNLSEEMQQHIKDLVTYGATSVKDFSGTLEGITEGDLRALVTAGKIDFATFSQIMATTFGDHAKDANKTFQGSMSNIQSALARTGAMFYQDLIKQEGPLVKLFNSVRLAINDFNSTLAPLAELWTNTVNSLATGAKEIIDIFVDYNEEARSGAKLMEPVIKYLVDFIEKYSSVVANVFGINNMDFKKIATDAANGFKEWASSLKVTDKELEIFEHFLKVVRDIFKTVINIGNTFFGVLKSVVGGLLDGLNFDVIFSRIYDLASIFKDFTESLKPTGEQLDKLRNFFSGIADVATVLFDIISVLVRDGLKYLGEIISEILPDGDRFFQTFSDVGDVLHMAADNLKEFFEATYGKLNLQPIIDAIREFIKNVKEFLHLDVISQKFTDFVKSLKDGSSDSKLPLFDRLSVIIDKLKEAADKVLPVVKENFDKVRESLANFVKGIGSEAGKFDGFDIIGAIGLGVSGGFISKILKTFSDITDKVNDALSFKDHLLEIKDAVVETFEGIQNSLKADILQKIAIAIGILAGALFVLSLIDVGKLGTSLAAISALMYEMTLVMNSVGKLSGNTKSMIKVSGVLVAFAGAIFVLSVAMRIISGIDAEGMGRSLFAISLLIWEMVGIMTVLSKVQGNVTKGAGSLVLMAAAITLLIVPIKILGGMDVHSLAQGLGSVIALIIALAGAMKLMSGVKVSSSLGLIAIAAAITILSKPVKELGSLNMTTLAKGLGSVAVMMLALAGAANLMPKNMTSIGVGMMAMAAALLIMSGAVQRLGSMDIMGLVAGVGSLIVLLGGLTLAANAMNGALPGAAAMLVMAAALLPMAVSLHILAAIPFAGLLLGLASLAAAFVIFGVAAYALIPVAPAMLAIAGAFVLFSAAAALTAVAFATVALAVATGGTALILFLTEVIALLPLVGVMLGQLIILAVATIGEAAPVIGQALLNILTTVLTVLGESIPLIIETLMSFLLELLTIFLSYVPQMADVGLQIIVAFLEAIANNIQSIVEAGMSIIIGFLEGVSNKLPEVIDAAFKLIISFINGLADAIRDNHNAIYDAVGNLIDAIIDAIVDLGYRIFDAGADFVQGFIDGLLSMPGALWDAAQGLAAEAWNGFCDFLGIASPSKLARSGGEFFAQGFVEGVSDLKDKAADETRSLAEAAMQSFEEALEDGYNPTITPVLDVSNIQNGISSMNSMFDSVPDTYGINGSIDARHTLTNNAMDILGSKNDYSDIITEMVSLRKDLSRYSELMSNLQVVMDTGSVVGVLGPALDRQLGRNVVLAGRGV